MFYKLSIKKCFEILFVILMTLPACYIAIDIMQFRLSILITILFFILYLFFNFKSFINNVIIFFKKHQTKIFLIWGETIVVFGFIQVILGNFTFLKYVFSIFFRFFCLIVIPFFIGFTLNKYCKTKEIVKIHYTAILIILIIGILDFIFSNFGNDFFRNLFSITITNNRTLLETEIIEKTTINGIYRIYSVFDEPSYLASFLCVNLPFLYHFKKCDFKIFSNKIFNFLIKNYLHFFVLLIIIGTMSPIFIVVAVLVTLFYNILVIRLTIKHFALITFCFIFIFLFTYLLFKIDLSSTFLGRIQDAFYNINSIQEFIVKNNSLGSRIICYINSFIIFLKNPLFGIGWGNLHDALHRQLSLSPVPLTPLLKSWLANNSSSSSFAIFWNSLAETGLCSTILLYYFYISVFKELDTQNKCNNLLDKYYAKSLFFVILTFVCLTIYDSRITEVYIWLLLGVAVGFEAKNNNKRGYNETIK